MLSGHTPVTLPPPLPASPATAGPTRADATAADTPAMGPEGGPRSLAQARILLVDDEPTNLRLLERVLQREGYTQLECLRSPLQVLPSYQRQRPDLILLDLNMPGLDGFGVLEQLKALQDPLLPPVIVITAQHQRHYLLEALTAGARDFISKPFDLHELALRVRNALEGRLNQLALHDMQAQLRDLVTLRTDALAKAESATRVKSEFLSNMSHELRTPMNAILGMLQLLETTPLNAKQAEYIRKTRLSARSLLDILNDILDFSKVEAGKMELAPEPFAFEPFLQELSFLLYSNLGDKPVELLFDIDPTLPPVLVGDALRLKQVLINLAGNAIKFTAEGQVCIGMHRQTTAEGLLLEFRISDSGIGIAPEQLQHIFEGFSQAEASTSRRFGGTGLGLAISQRLVQLMGGSLQVDSVLGEGSTFHVTLPLGMAQEMPDAAHEAPPIPSAWPQGWQVLVLESSPAAQGLVQGLLQDLGWQVTLVSTPEQALAHLRQPLATGGAFNAVFANLEALQPQAPDWLNRLRTARPDARPKLFLIARPGSELRWPPEAQASVDGWLFQPLTAYSLRQRLGRWAQHGHIDAPPPRPAQDESAPPLQGIRILLVEDNPINQDVAMQLLDHAGAQVALAEDGQEAVDRLAQGGAEDFDLVLMDMQMGVMDGLQATRMIRQQLQLTALPIVAMTANAMASDRQACLDAGMNEHIGKPFDAQELVAMVLRMLGRAPATGALPTPPPGAPQTTASTLSTAPTDAAALTLDDAGAIARLNGNERLYSQLLRQWLQAVDEDWRTVQRRWHEGDAIQTARALHKLKGGTSVIGAEALAAALAKAESALTHTGASPQALSQPGTLAALQALVREAQTAAAAFLQAQAPAPSPASLGATAASGTASAALPLQRLHTLSTLLERSDMEALDLWDELVLQHAWQDNPHAQAVQSAMDLMDFSSAQHALAAWLDATGTR